MGVEERVGAVRRKARVFAWRLLGWRPRRCRGEPDVFVVSFPKCGRTWLRLMLGKALALHYGVEGVNLLELEQLARACPQIPLIRMTHDGRPQLKRPGELAPVKAEYAGRRVVLLVRDVRDVVVSCYFEYSRRRKLMTEGRCYAGDLSTFLRAERGSVDTVIAFYNIWAENRHVPASLLLVRYEDLHADAEGELRRVLRFCGIDRVSDDAVRTAVAYARFERMHRMEREDAFRSNRLRPGNRDDPESFKTRRGKVGGFVDYVSGADLEYLDQRVKELSDFYGYGAA